MFRGMLEERETPAFNVCLDGVGLFVMFETSSRWAVFAVYRLQQFASCFTRNVSFVLIISTATVRNLVFFPRGNSEITFDDRG